MEDYKNFLELENQGSIIYIYADRYNIFVVYEDIEDKKFYLFSLDKGLIVEAVHEIKFPEEFEDADVEWVHWYNPKHADFGGYIFRGVLIIDDVTCHFEINDKAELILFDREIPYKYDPAKMLKDELGYVENLKPEVFAVKNGRTHIAGVNSDSEQVYCVVDTNKESCVKRYTLHSDVGEIKVNAITVDTHDNRVYLAGEINRYNTDGSYQNSIPYLEMFLN